MSFFKIKNIFWKAARHHYSIFVILLMLALVWGGFLFFHDFVLVKEASPQIIIPAPIFNQGAHEGFEKILEIREENLKNIELKSYLNPFQEATSTGEEGDQTI